MRVRLLIVVITSVLASRPLWAQERPEARDLAEPEYAMRVAVERVAETIRHGRVDYMLSADPEIARSVGELAVAAIGRTFVPPAEDLGILWDFCLDVSDVRPLATDAYQVRARAYLATDESGAAEVVFVFRRLGRHWVLERHDGFVDQLRTIAQRLAEGSGQ